MKISEFNSNRVKDITDTQLFEIVRFESSDKMLGGLCKRGHDYRNSGLTIRYKSGAGCCECIRLQKKQYTVDNQDHILERNRKYEQKYRTADDKKRNKNNRAKRMIENGGNHTGIELDESIALFNGECAYCGDEYMEMDHIVPVVKGGNIDISNLVPVCRKCNQSKGSSDISYWYPKQDFYDVDKMEKIVSYSGYSDLIQEI